MGYNRGYETSVLRRDVQGEGRMEMEDCEVRVHPCKF